jgi:hypothetical protein
MAMGRSGPTTENIPYPSCSYRRRERLRLQRWTAGYPGICQYTQPQRRAWNGGKRTMTRGQLGGSAIKGGV